MYYSFHLCATVKVQSLFHQCQLIRKWDFQRHSLFHDLLNLSTNVNGCHIGCQKRIYISLRRIMFMLRLFENTHTLVHHTSPTLTCGCSNCSICQWLCIIATPVYIWDYRFLKTTFVNKNTQKICQGHSCYWWKNEIMIPMINRNFSKENNYKNTWITFRVHEEISKEYLKTKIGSYFLFLLIY